MSFIRGLTEKDPSTFIKDPWDVTIPTDEKENFINDVIVYKDLLGQINETCLKYFLQNSGKIKDSPSYVGPPEDDVKNSVEEIKKILCHKTIIVIISNYEPSVKQEKSCMRKGNINGFMYVSPKITFKQVKNVFLKYKNVIDFGLYNPKKNKYAEFVNTNSEFNDDLITKNELKDFQCITIYHEKDKWEVEAIGLKKNDSEYNKNTVLVTSKLYEADIYYAIHNTTRIRLGSKGRFIPENNSHIIEFNVCDSVFGMEEKNCINTMNNILNEFE